LGLVAGVFSILLTGGLIKGMTGLGLPLFVLSVLSGLLQPHLIITLLLVPVIASNIWLALSTGGSRQALARFWPLIAAFGLGTYGGARLLAGVPTQTLLLLLGLVVVVFCAMSSINPKPRLGRPLENWFGPGVGIVAGILNGLAMVNGPPIMMYLVALDLDRDELVGTYALIALSGSIPLAASFLALGVVRIHQLPLSGLALIPVFMGLLLGQRLRSQINQRRFRQALLAVLVVLGLNLVRRGLGVGLL